MEIHDAFCLLESWILCCSVCVFSVSRSSHFVLWAEECGEMNWSIFLFQCKLGINKIIAKTIPWVSRTLLSFLPPTTRHDWSRMPYSVVLSTSIHLSTLNLHALLQRDQTEHNCQRVSTELCCLLPPGLGTLGRLPSRILSCLLLHLSTCIFHS